MNWDGSVTEAKEGWRLNDSGHINNGNSTDNISHLYYAYFVLNLAVSILLILANVVCFLNWVLLPSYFMMKALFSYASRSYW